MRSTLIFLSHLEDSDVAWLVHACQKRILKPQEILIKRGTVNQDIYMVLQGKCAVKAANNLHLGEIESGELVGEISFVDQRKTTSEVCAVTPVTLAHLPESTLSTKFKSDVGFSARFYRGVASVLAYRLRLNLQVAISGRSDILRSEEEFAGQLDMQDLDATARAGARLEFMVKALA